MVHNTILAKDRPQWRAAVYGSKSAVEERRLAQYQRTHERQQAEEAKNCYFKTAETTKCEFNALPNVNYIQSTLLYTSYMLLGLRFQLHRRKNKRFVVLSIKTKTRRPSVCVGWHYLYG